MGHKDTVKHCGTDFTGSRKVSCQVVNEGGEYI